MMSVKFLIVALSLVVTGFCNCCLAANLGEECDTSSQCVVPNSLCSANKCVCKPDFVANDNSECLPLVELEESCKISQQCKPDGSECNNVVQKCVCKVDRVPFNGMCLPKAELGELCEIDAQCTAENSECYDASGDKKCSCKDSHYPSNGQCLPKAGLGEACVENPQCSVEHSECVGGLCRCKITHTPAGDQCVPKSGLGESCEIDEQCYVPNSKCQNNKCSCFESYDPVGSDQCIPREDEEIGFPFKSIFFMIKNSTLTNSTINFILNWFPGTNQTTNSTIIPWLSSRCWYLNKCVL